MLQQSEMETTPDSAKKSRVLICIPTYNESQNVAAIVSAVFDAVPDANVLVVDDNSPDGTGRIADALAETDGRLHVLHRQFKQGLGKAYLDAFAWALEQGYDIIFEFDADFSHNPNYLPSLITVLQSGAADVVVGSRRVKGGGVLNRRPHRRLISWGGSVYARLILGIHIYDLTGGFNGFRREALEKIELDKVESTGYCFQIELKYRSVKKGLRVIEHPIIFPDRIKGTSKMSNAIFSEAFLQVLKLRLNNRV